MSRRIQYTLNEQNIIIERIGNSRNNISIFTIENPLYNEFREDDKNEYNIENKLKSSKSKRMLKIKML